MTLKRRTLHLESLEQREVPSATNFTLDFVPDNSSLFGQNSSFFSTFGNSASAAETQILAAFQTWADVANINFGVVTGEGPNSPTPYADPSLSSTIHIGMVSLANGVAAISTPVGAQSANAGDMMLNSNQSFSIAGSSGAYDLYTVALHEVGILLGLPENSTSSSVMDSIYQGTLTGLSSGDVSAIQALYGPPAGNTFAGPSGNYTLQTAYTVNPALNTPVIGNLLTQSETDYYQFQLAPGGYSTTITLNDSGFSLFEADVIVYNQNGAVVATSSVSDPRNNTISLTIASPTAPTKYYVEVTGGNNTVFGTGAYSLLVAPTATAPVVSKAASASQTQVTGTSAQLQVQATDADGATPTYSWSVTSAPAGAPAPTFNNPTSNNTAVTFYQAGVYVFTVSVMDPSGLFTTSSVTVNVAQTLTSLNLTPGSAVLSTGTPQQFTATALDQFGNALATQPSLTWQVNGSATISNTGLFDATATGNYQVKVSVGPLTGQANISVIAAATTPVVSKAASAGQTLVAGANTQLQVQATDADGAVPTYSWSVTSSPAGAPTPTFNNPSTNNTNVTFYQAGTYVFTVTIADPSGLFTTSSVTVNVAQTLTSLSVSPGSACLLCGVPQQFTATALDQFGNALATQPSLTWQVNGSATISSAGLFSAANTGNYQVKVSVGPLNAQANITVVTSVATPTVTNAASAAQTIVTGASTQLQVQATDSDGQKPIYSWSVTSSPAGAPAPTFNNANANNTNVNFYQAGTYTFTVTIADPSGLFTTSSVTVNVVQTLTKLSLTPGTVSLTSGSTLQFSAVDVDQFGNAMALQPAMTWQLNGSGTISNTGLFTAYGYGNVQVKVSAGSLNAQANVTVSAPAGVPPGPPPAPVNANLTSPVSNYSGTFTASTQVQTYNVTVAPNTFSASGYLLISATTPTNPINPLVTICNAQGQIITSTLLVEQSGTMTIEVSNVVNGEHFVVYVTSSTGGLGSFNVSMNLSNTPYSCAQTTGTLNSATPSAFVTLDVTQTQVIHFALTGQTTDGSTAAALVLTILNSQNQVVATMTVQAGDGESMDVLLLPGTYTVEISDASPSNVNFALTTYVVSNPIAVAPVNPTSSKTSTPPASSSTATTTTTVTTTTGTTTTTSGSGSSVLIKTTPTGGVVLN